MAPTARPGVTQMAASKAKGGRPGIKVISKNRAARHNYAIDETFEAGIELTGAEVKSLRDRAAQLTDTFVLIRGGEVWLNGMHIHPYVDYMEQKLRTKGVAIVPLQMYFDEHNRVKLTIALATGKKLYDKRADMARRDADREIRRVLKERSRA